MLWMPALAVMWVESTTSPPREPPPDRALLEFLGEFAEAGPASAEEEIDPLWLATADAAAQMDPTRPAAKAEPGNDAETDDDRPR